MSHTSLSPDIHFTENAISYLKELLAKQDTSGMNVRMFVTNPGTPHAETCLAYCKPDAHKEDDIEIKLDGFSAWLECSSTMYLNEGKIDYTEDKMGGQLTIKAPNAKLPQISDESTMEDKINYYLHTEINPNLAAHGGMVSLIEMDENIAILQFGGGCQGCGMVDVTLKDGVEKTLKEKIAELEGVIDITNHTNRENAYYK